MRMNYGNENKIIMVLKWQSSSLSKMLSFISLKKTPHHELHMPQSQFEGDFMLAYKQCFQISRTSVYMRVILIQKAESN